MFFPKIHLKKLFFVFFLYTVITGVYTFPLLFRLKDSTYGYSGDNLGSIHYFWWWQESFLKGRDVRDGYLEESPFGVTIDREPGTIFFYLPVKTLTLILDEVSAYNLVLIFSFPAAALSMYLLVEYLVSKPLVSFLAGFIFSFSPFHFWKAYNHLDLALIYPLPLFLLALLYLERKSKEAKKWRSMLLPVTLLSASWALTILTNFYYGYFLFLLIIFYVFSKVVMAAVISKRFYLRRKLFFSLGAAGIISLLISAPTTAHVFLDALGPSKSTESFLRVDSYQRPLLNLVSLSARPWDYLLPSTDHPFFGKTVASIYQRLKERGRDFKTVSAPVHERTIYLGIINIVGFLLSLILLSNKEYRERFGKPVLTLSLTAFFLFLVSLPPYVFLKGRTFYLPSFFLYQIFPMFRTYARLGILVLMITTVISATVLVFLFEKFSDRKILRRTSIFLLLSLAFFDFLNFPPFKVIGLTPAPSYKWLGSKKEEFSIIEYPKDFNVAESLFFQRIHGKGVLNFHAQSPYFKLWDVFEDYINPRSSAILSSLGVKYAVFHKKLLFPQANPVDDLWYKRAFKDLPYYQGGFPGFNLVADFPEAAIFEIVGDGRLPYLVIISGGEEDLKVDKFPTRGWSWSGRDNTVYVINLTPNPLSKISLSLDFGESRNVPRVPKVGEDGKVRLVLSRELTELTVSKVDGGLVNFGDVEVSFE